MREISSRHISSLFISDCCNTSITITDFAKAGHGVPTPKEKREMKKRIVRNGLEKIMIQPLPFDVIGHLQDIICGFDRLAVDLIGPLGGNHLHHLFNHVDI